MAQESINKETVEKIKGLVSDFVNKPLKKGVDVLGIIRKLKERREKKHGK
jgi:hypothetical protein